MPFDKRVSISESDCRWLFERRVVASLYGSNKNDRNVETRERGYLGGRIKCVDMIGSEKEHDFFVLYTVKCKQDGRRSGFSDGQNIMANRL